MKTHVTRTGNHESNFDSVMPLLQLETFTQCQAPVVEHWHLYALFLSNTISVDNILYVCKGHALYKSCSGKRELNPLPLNPLCFCCTSLLKTL